MRTFSLLGAKVGRPPRRAGVSSTAQDEAPRQERRKMLLSGFFVLLVIFSIGLELNHRYVARRGVAYGQGEGALGQDEGATGQAGIQPGDLLFGLFAILRNVVPPVAMLYLVLWMGARFTQGVYGMSDADEAKRYLRASLFGPPTQRQTAIPTRKLARSAAKARTSQGGAGATVIVENGRVVKPGPNDPVMRIGGPGTLVVYSDSAVLLERAGRLTRVVGPGVTVLHRFEKVRDVVHLRPLSFANSENEKTIRVEGMSRDGIPVVWPITVRYQINDDGWGRHLPTEGRPYGFSEEAVLKACSDVWMRGAGSDAMHWGDCIVSVDAKGILRDILATYPLDRLIQPLRDLIDLLSSHFNEGELLNLCELLDVPSEESIDRSRLDIARSLVRYLELNGRIVQLIDMAKQLRPEQEGLWEQTRYPRQQVMEDLENQLRERAPSHGARILSLELHNLELRDPVIQQWIETWQAKWKRLADEQLATARAERAFELRRSDAAFQELLRAIKEELENLEDDDDSMAQKVLVVHLIETLRHRATNARSSPLIRDLHSATRLWKALEALLQSGEQSDEPGAAVSPDRPLPGTDPEEGGDYGGDDPPSV
jgi:hypothetical protein